MMMTMEDGRKIDLSMLTNLKLTEKVVNDNIQ